MEQGFQKCTRLIFEKFQKNRYFSPVTTLVRYHWISTFERFYVDWKSVVAFAVPKSTTQINGIIKHVEPAFLVVQSWLHSIYCVRKCYGCYSVC